LEICWSYFPDPAIPFYRVTHLSKYSSANVPGNDTQTYGSFLCEIPYSDYLPVDRKNIVEETIAGLIRGGLLKEEDRKLVVSTHVIDSPYAYPIPTLARNAALREIQPWLESKNIFSRGRFGTWQYEIGNSDHAFMMGMEIIDRILDGKAETTYRLS